MTEENAPENDEAKAPDFQIDIEDFRLKFLEPENIKFFRAGDALRLTIEGDRTCLRVVLMRSFPLSMRDNYISVRDMEGNELGMIRDPGEMDKETQKLLKDELRKRYITPEILQIRSISDKFGTVEWEVETDRGTKKFMTQSLHDSLKETESGYIITDIENNRYEIRDYSRLDPQSSGILSRRI